MNPNNAQSSDEIMTETNRTRAEIERNLEALEQRLSPDEVLDQIGQAVAPARDGAVEFARNLADTVRENPIPAAMVGIGLGWLLLSGRRSDPAMDERPERVDPYAHAHDPSLDNENGSRKERMRQAKDWAQQRSGDVRDTVSRTADTAYRRTSDTAHRAGARIANGTAEVGNFVQRRPILTGAAVAGLGAVIAAAAFARTDRGRVTMARASDTARDGSQRVSDAARAAAQNVSEAAASAKGGNGADPGDVPADGGTGTYRPEAPETTAEDVTGGATRSVSEQIDADAKDDDVLKPVAVKPVPVSPAKVDGDVPSTGSGEINHHDAHTDQTAKGPLASKL